MQNGIKFAIFRKESCNIYYIRNMCLGADVSRGKNQKPFDGKIDYDYLMWIDSDIVFTPKHFQILLNHDKDIVSGIYMMDRGNQFATVKEWDEEFFKKNGYFQFLTPEDIKNKKELIEVSYTGFGFILIKKGVFESMTYPWFRPIDKKIGNMVDFTMEDVAFCIRAKEKGFKIWIDPQVRVGHEKKVVF
jgi:GT2 family glycosyltransferase